MTTGGNDAQGGVSAAGGTEGAAAPSAPPRGSAAGPVNRNGETAENVAQAVAAMEGDFSDGVAPPADDASPPDDAPPVDDPAPRGRAKGPTALAMAAMEAVPILTLPSGTIYSWNGRFWQSFGKYERPALALRHGGRTASQRREMVDYWQAATMRSGHKWGRLSSSEIGFDDGVLDLETMTLRPHDPEDYLERVVPHPWRGGAVCPFWLARLEDWFGSIEDERVAALQEYIGYCLAQHAKYKKALLLYGDSNTGKSRIPDLISRMVGEDNACSVDLDALDDPVLRASIMGKAVNIISELAEGALIKDGAFKTMVSTEEPILVNEKWAPVMTYRPTAKFVVATNTLPAISDRSAATFNRLLIIRFDRVFADAEQIPADEFDAAIDAELGGIIAWAVEGLRRLWRNSGRFTVPASSTETLAAYRVEQNPLQQFLEERCRVEPDGAVSVTTDQLLRAFNGWNEGGRRWSKTRLGRTLAQLGIETRPVKVKGRAMRVACGVELLPDQAVARRLDVRGDHAVELEEAGPGEVEDQPADDATVPAGAPMGPGADDVAPDGSTSF